LPRKRIGLLLAVALAGVGLHAATASAATQATKPTVVTVIMTDYHFRLVGKPVKAGVPVVFKTVNKGHAVHNFDLQKVKAGKIVGPGRSTSFKVVVKKKGRYQFICDVPRHAELGMAGTLVVR
jgi:uncharacterized cupredoxin-like copper-binding protein